MKGKAKALQIGTKRLLITDSLRTRFLRNNNFAIIIVTGKRPYIEKNILPQYLPETIVFSSETPSGSKIPFTTEQITDKKIRYVRKSGAYICGL